MFAALLPLIAPLLSGSSLASAVGALSLSQWVTIGEGILSASPEELSIISQLGSVLSPFLTKLVSDVQHAATPHAASASAAVWFAQNADAAISRQPGIAGQ